MAFNQPLTWSGFGKAAGIGALGGALSGGIGSIGGLIGNQAAFGILGQVSSYATTTAIQGKPLTLNGLIGLGVSSGINGAIPGFQGIEGSSALSNIGAELAYDAAISGVSRGIGSGVESSLNGKSFGEGFGEGFLSGLVGGAIQSASKIALLGRANPPSDPNTQQALAEMEGDMSQSGYGVGKYKPTYRTGGLYKQLGPKGAYGRPRGIALGNNLLVGYGYSDDYLHETVHYFDMMNKGFGAFLSRGAYEQWFMVNPYLTVGTQEWWANELTKFYLKLK